MYKQELGDDRELLAQTCNVGGDNEQVFITVYSTKHLKQKEPDNRSSTKTSPNTNWVSIFDTPSHYMYNYGTTKINTQHLLPYMVRANIDQATYYFVPNSWLESNLPK